METMSGMPGFRRRTGSGLAAWLTRAMVALSCMDLLKGSRYCGPQVVRRV